MRVLASCHITLKLSSCTHVLVVVLIVKVLALVTLAHLISISDT
jgi:hypothetical protein